MGYAHADSAVVTHAFGPGEKGIRARGCVRVEGEEATERVYELQKVTEGELYYLGDWHVHLGALLIPSSLDKKAAQLLLEDNACPTKVYLDVIFSRMGVKAACFSYDAGLIPKSVRLLLCSDVSE